MKHDLAKTLLPKSESLAKRLCRWCGGPITAKHRRAWCGQACVDEYRLLHDWTHVRRQVEKRDRGVCRLCGISTERVRSIYRLLRSEWGWEAARQWIKANGFRPGSANWEADHIVPRCEGGTNELSNLRTLCCPCHKNVTAQQARRRAERRRQEGEAA